MRNASIEIELQDVSQSFHNGQHEVQLFKELSLTMQQGQSYAITGPSGSGKSSLLMLLSGLETPTSGRCIAKQNGKVFDISQAREKIGFVFQQFHLLPELTALHNVALPLKLRGLKNAEQQARKWLEKVGLGERLDNRPQQLSGGEQQRAAIARALVFKPAFIFADEPTGNLDSQCADEITDLLFECCQDGGAGLVLVTHSNALAQRAQQRFNLINGSLLQLTQAQREVQYA